MKCIKCNSDVADGMQFCPYCGNPMSQKCEKCGAELEIGATFCSNCGNRIEQVSQAQQPNQGQYQQPNQGQYQQPYRQQKPQLPHRPQLTFMEAFDLATHRLTEIEGRSRRSEYWWWFLAVGLGSIIIGFIPYVGNLAYIAQFFFLYAITIRRLQDCSAPDWLSKMYPVVFGLYSICMTLFGFYADDHYGFARDIIRFIDRDGTFFYTIFALAGILSLVVFIYSIKDSNPDVDPIHGPSPKYTM